MADVTGFFVQFPHPGGEHNPPDDDMPWNRGDHRRKSLVTPGRYLDEDDHLGEAALVYWAEWEPPSRVQRRWPASGRLPRVLHQPYWTEPATRRFRQNTDPWVWGGRGAGRSPLPSSTVRIAVADTDTPSFFSSPWTRQ